MERLLPWCRNELQALFVMYRKLVAAAQAAAPTTGIGQPVSKVDVRLGLLQTRRKDVAPHFVISTHAVCELSII